MSGIMVSLEILCAGWIYTQKQIWGRFANWEPMKTILNPEVFGKPYAHIHANVAEGEQQNRSNSE